MFVFFFFNDTATTEIYTLSLHDALPICPQLLQVQPGVGAAHRVERPGGGDVPRPQRQVALDHLQQPADVGPARSEEHTSELQSRQYLVCRLLLEKKKTPLNDAIVSFYVP